jgi:hypothetical protein
MQNCVEIIAAHIWLLHLAYIVFMHLTKYLSSIVTLKQTIISQVIKLLSCCLGFPHYVPEGDDQKTVKTNDVIVCIPGIKMSFCLHNVYTLTKC